MDRMMLRQALVEILEDERGERVECLDDTLCLRAGLGLDASDLGTLGLAVQQRFYVDLRPDELAQVQKVGSLLDLIQDKFAARSAA